MKAFKVTYSGNSTRFRDFEYTVGAKTPREAVEKIYQRVLDSNYFPQTDGCIKDCDGNLIAEKGDDTIEYDGGQFSAEEVSAEEVSNKIVSQ